MQPKKKRFVHIDQSLSGDSTGVACCFISGYKEEEGVLLPIVQYDFMLRIDPPKKPAEIDIGKVRGFILYLRNKYDIDFHVVTYDMFASSEARQGLRAAGINADYLSVDRNDEAYLSFVNMVFEDRVRIYRYLPFEQELFNLVHNRARRKVDHPMNGSKDVADGVAGSIFNALTFSETTGASDTQGDIVDFLSANVDPEERHLQELEQGLLGIGEFYIRGDNDNGNIF